MLKCMVLFLASMRLPKQQSTYACTVICLLVCKTGRLNHTPIPLKQILAQNLVNKQTNFYFSCFIWGGGLPRIATMAARVAMMGASSCCNLGGVPGRRGRGGPLPAAPTGGGGTWPGWVVVESQDLDMCSSVPPPRSSSMCGWAGSGGDRPCSATTILIAGLALWEGVGEADLAAGGVGVCTFN
jgi:hypothetical protein